MPCLLTAICHFKDEIEDLTDVHSQQIRKLFFRFFQRTIERGNKLIYRKFCSTVSERNSHAIYLPRIVLAACHVGSLVFFFFLKLACTKHADYSIRTCSAVMYRVAKIVLELVS